VNGHGKLVKPNGFHYEGEWVNNMPEGKGMETWPDHTSYKGMYKAGCKHGIGRFEWALKHNAIGSECYLGSFKNDLFDGHGRYQWADGRIYNGKWRTGKMDGEGEFQWSDGRVYEGEYL
jgi:hypothetical protein